MPASSRQHKCLRCSSQEGNKANLFPLLHIKRLFFSLLYKTIMGSAQREEEGPAKMGFNSYVLIQHTYMLGYTFEHACAAHVHTHTLADMNLRSCISNELAEVRKQSQWEVAQGRCPHFTTPAPNICTHAHAPSPLATYFFFPHTAVLLTMNLGQ